MCHLEMLLRKSTYIILRSDNSTTILPEIRFVFTGKEMKAAKSFPFAA